MALVTAAVTAVGVAIASTTVATVAAAVVAVSALVGAVGLAVTAVGLVTGNKTMTKIGGIMGMVGLAGGVAGWAAGSLAPVTAGADQVGSFFAAPDGGYGAAQAVGQGTVLAPAPAVAAPVGAGTVLAPAGDLSSALVSAQPVSTTPIADAAGTGKTAAGAPIGNPESLAAPAPTPPAPVAGAEQNYQSLLNSANQAPGVTSLGNIPKPEPGGIAKWWESLPPSMQSAIALSGGQTLAGAAGGLFQGMSASDKLEFEKLMNQQNENQRQLLNKNNSYAPRIGFQRPSLINSPKAGRA